MWRNVRENVGSTDMYLIITSCLSRKIISLKSPYIQEDFSCVLFSFHYSILSQQCGFQQGEEGRDEI